MTAPTKADAVYYAAWDSAYYAAIAERGPTPDGFMTIADCQAAGLIANQKAAAALTAWENAQIDAALAAAKDLIS